MSLLESLASQVGQIPRETGQELHERGDADILAATAEGVDAAVERFLVMLERGEDTIYFCCACPYYVERLAPCEHVWAALLAAHDEGHLSEWNIEGVELVPQERLGDDPVDPVDWAHPLELVHDPLELRRLEPGEPPPRPVPQPTPEAPAPPPGPRPRPGWKHHINRARQAARTESHGQPGVWPPRREIHYAVECDRLQHLVVETATRDRKMNGQWGRLNPQTFSHLLVISLPDPADRQILSQLMGGKAHAGYVSYQVSSRFRLGTLLAHSLLPLMCRTGRCFFRAEPGQLELRPITWDDGEPWRFWIEVAPNAARTLYQMRGSLRRDGYGPNQERGVFRTTNGGETWDKVLYVDHNTGASMVELDPSEPRTVFAGLYEHRVGPWENGRFSGPGTGLYKSTDGGSTWRRLSKGLPAADWGPLFVGVAPSNSKRIFLTVSARGGGGLYRSDDGGERAGH